MILPSTWIVVGGSCRVPDRESDAPSSVLAEVRAGIDREVSVPIPSYLPVQGIPSRRNFRIRTTGGNPGFRGAIPIREIGCEGDPRNARWFSNSTITFKLILPSISVTVM